MHRTFPMTEALKSTEHSVGNHWCVPWHPVFFLHLETLPFAGTTRVPVGFLAVEESVENNMRILLKK
jgi:hypothetical protein